MNRVFTQSQRACALTTHQTRSITFNNIGVGSYIFHALKSSLSCNSAETTVKSQQTTSVTIVLQEDVTAPHFVTLSPANLGNSQQWVFTVTAGDNIDGTALPKNLYIDEIPVET